MKRVSFHRVGRGSWGFAFAIFLGCAALALDRAETGRERHLDNTMEFPRLSATTDDGDTLSEYPQYLKFVLEIGKEVDRATSDRLANVYTELRRRDASGAARFLRGLRFEMVQKLEMTGMSPEQATTRNPMVRKWVGRYLSAWYREADEYLFRAKSAGLVKR